MGKSLEGKPNKFNDKNLGYVQLKYGGEKLKREVEENEVETFVEQPPTVIITVAINTITNNGVVLSNNLPKDRYRESDINRTEVFVTVSDYKTGAIKTLISKMKNDFTVSESRDKALVQVHKHL